MRWFQKLKFYMSASQVEDNELRLWSLLEVLDNGPYFCVCGRRERNNPCVGKEVKGRSTLN